MFRDNVKCSVILCFIQQACSVYGFICSFHFIIVCSYRWWHVTVVRTSVYGWQTFPGLHHVVQLTGDLLRVNCPLNVSQHGADKWVVRWSQAFAMHICVVVQSGECLRVKADMVMFAGNTVWTISERVRGIRQDVLHKFVLPSPLSFSSAAGFCIAFTCFRWYFTL